MSSLLTFLCINIFYILTLLAAPSFLPNSQVKPKIIFSYFFLLHLPYQQFAYNVYPNLTNVYTPVITTTIKISSLMPFCNHSSIPPQNTSAFCLI